MTAEKLEVDAVVKAFIRSSIRRMKEAWKLQIGAALREARGRADLTQEQLADRVGMSAEAISNIERGSSLPTLETLYKIAVAVNSSISDLIGEPPSSLKSQKRSALESQLQVTADALDDRLLDVAVKQMALLRNLR